MFDACLAPCLARRAFAAKNFKHFCIHPIFTQVQISKRKDQQFLTGKRNWKKKRTGIFDFLNLQGFSITFLKKAVTFQRANL
jgi:hypothetical protein